MDDRRPSDRWISGETINHRFTTLRPWCELSTVLRRTLTYTLGWSGNARRDLGGQPTHSSLYGCVLWCTKVVLKYWKRAWREASQPSHAPQPPRSAGPQSHESRRLQPPPPPPHLPLRARAAADTTITTQGHQTTTPPGYAASSTAPSLRSHGAQNTVAGPHSFQWPPSQAAIWHSRVQKCAASHTAQ